jgi:prepilin peptidase CpaA
MAHHLPGWTQWVFGAASAVAAVTDYRVGKIHNWLTLPLLAGGLVLAAVLGWNAVLDSAGGVGVAAAIFIPLFAAGVLGGGDVKLLLALGTVTGARGMLELAGASLMVAGAGAVALLVLHRRVRPFFRELGRFFRTLLTPELEVQWPRLDRSIKAPFGIAIFLGYLCVIAKG